MKKILCTSAALCVAALLVLTSCSKAGGGDIVGKWKYSLNSEIRDLLTEVIADSAVYSDIYYEFRSDGTGCTYSTNDSEPMNFTYTFDGTTLHIDSDNGSFDTACTVNGDIMTVTENGDRVDFRRQ